MPSVKLVPCLNDGYYALLNKVSLIKVTALDKVWVINVLIIFI